MRQSRTFQIALLGMFGALIIMQAYVPMVGYIRVFPAWPAISTIHLTVILSGVTLGVRGGAMMGGLWGTISLIKAYTEAADPLTFLLFRNPVIALVPRIATGIIAALAFQLIAKRAASGWAMTLRLSVAGVLGTLTNTLGVIGLTWLFFFNQASTIVPGASAGNLGWLMIGMFSINAGFEIAMAAILTPLIGTVLLRLKRRKTV